MCGVLLMTPILGHQAILNVFIEKVILSELKGFHGYIRACAITLFSPVKLAYLTITRVIK